MSEKLCTLRTQGGGGGGAKQITTVLWTNPSPSSNFAGQTVTLSDDIKNYDYVGIRCSAGSNYPNGTYIYYKVADILSNQTVVSGYRTWLVSSDESYAVVRYRQFTVASNGTDLTFTGGYRQNNTSNNSDCRPLAIIGIKNIGGIRTNEKYGQCGWVSIPASDYTWNCQGTPKAVWEYIVPTTYSNSEMRTNVNPSTGVVDNTQIWRYLYDGTAPSILSGQTWVVGTGTITTTTAGSNRKACLAYTY